MEENKAISILSHMKNLITVRTYEEKALEMAIQALEEIQQYKALEQRMNGVSLELLAEHFIKIVGEGESEGYQRGRLLTNEHADMWDAYKAIGTPEKILANFNDGAVTLEQSKVVIEAFMRKIEEYEAIGTVEECRAAMEKQRAKRPSDYQIDDEYDSGYCPCCGKAVYDDGGGYCPYCGQKLEWDEEE